MILFLKNIIVKKIIKIIDLKLSYAVKPELFRLHQLIKDFERSRILGSILKGVDVNIDPSAILIVKENASINFEGQNYIGRNVEIQPDRNVEIGYGTSIQDRNIILGDVQIGRYCLTAPNVYMSSGNHFYNYQPENYIKNQDKILEGIGDQKVLSNPIVIDDDVWIGINSVIMRGVKIGKGAIIGSNSVVTKNVLPYSIVAGNPAKEIKKRINFTPKRQLLYSKLSDLPFFYSGFLLDQKNLDKSYLLGGLFAGSKFTIFVDTKNCNFIKLILKNNMYFNLFLQLNEQTKEIKNHEFITIEFNLNNLQQFLNFNILNCNEIYNPYLIIKSIEVYEKQN